MRRKGSEVLTRITTIALLSALGFVLMAFVRIPYPLAPWLMIEFSDLVVLISYAMYGFTGGFSVSVIKTLLDMLIHGPTGYMGIGNITALLTSLAYVLGLFITSHVLKLFKKGWKFRLLGYGIIIMLVAVILTALNAVFITPTFLTGQFATCFDNATIEGVVNALGSYFPGVNNYFLLIFIAYFPFNLLKGVIVCALYELVFNRLIFVLMQRSPVMKKYFLGPVFFEKKIEEQTKETEETPVEETTEESLEEDKK